MNKLPTPEERMTEALDNYLELSDILMKDLRSLLGSKSESQHWRRNYIRVSASLIEGYTHCYREMCQIGLDFPNSLSNKEKKVLSSEQGFATDERFKLSLRAAYKLFGLEPLPDFGGLDWQRAKLYFEKRHQLMHPKNKVDFQVSGESWKDLYEGCVWLIEQLINFINFSHKKYIKK